MQGRQCERENCALWCNELNIPLSAIGDDSDTIRLIVGLIQQLSQMGVTTSNNTIHVAAHCTMRGKQ